MANGDILIHNGLYGSAEQADGSYDFTPFFEYVKDWISSADLAIGDYEGTISLITLWVVIRFLMHQVKSLTL